MARSKSWFAPLSVLFFFLAGAGWAIFQGLRQRAVPPSETAPATSAPVVRKRPAARIPERAAAVRPAPARSTGTSRKAGAEFERVGIPMKSRAGSRPPAAGLSEAQAQRVLKSLIESQGYYGFPPDCLWARPLGYRDSSYAFEIVTGECESVVRGSVIARWNIDASSGEASYRTPGGAFQRAP